MDVSDLIVEVRDATLARVGQIDADDLPGAIFTPAFRTPGAWQLTLAGDHPMVEHLRKEGAGIIVSAPGEPIPATPGAPTQETTEVLISGPMVSALESRTPSTPDGRWVFTGISDLHTVEDPLAAPSPEVEDLTAQTRTNDVRRAAAETLLHQFVAANVGPLAPGARRNPRLVMGVDLGRGEFTQKSPRFQNLLELLQEICTGTDLFFDVRQQDGHLIYVTGVCPDRRAEIRLDIENEQLDEIESGLSAPDVTDVVVAGQGEGTERTFLIRSAPPETAAWGRRIERFLDQRQTDDMLELASAGESAIAEGGSTLRSLKLLPTSDLVDVVPVTTLVGSWITAVQGTREIPARVHSATIAVQATGVFISITIGDDVPTDWESDVDSSLKNVEARVSSLERNGTQPASEWVDCIFSPGFGPSTASQGGAALQVRRHPSGDIEIRGGVAVVGDPVPAGDYEIVATLPDSTWWPSNPLIKPRWGSYGGSGRLCGIEIDTLGGIRVVHPTAARGGSDTPWSTWAGIHGRWSTH